MLNIFINLLLAVHIVVCVLIVIAALMQRPKNEGLGAAFGGGMTESLFGAQTTNVLATITRWLGVVFFVLTLVLSALYARQGRTTTGVTQKLEESAKPVVPVSDLKPLVPASGEEKKADSPSPTPSPEVPKTVEPKAEAPIPKAPEVPAPVAPEPAKAPASDAKSAPEKVPVPAPEAPKSDLEKENAPILKVPAPELNPAPAPQSKAGEAAPQ